MTRGPFGQFRSDIALVALLTLFVAAAALVGCQRGLDSEQDPEQNPEQDREQARDTQHRPEEPGPPADADANGVDTRESGREMIHLRIGGTDGTRFVGQCTVTGADGGERVIPFDDATPIERDIVGVSVACTFTQASDTGRLHIELRQAGNTARSRTAGRDSTIRIRMR